MRSSVSAILSTPTQDPNMSHPDYEMTVYDHGTLLILVKHLGKQCDGAYIFLAYIFRFCFVVYSVFIVVVVVCSQGEELSSKSFNRYFDRICRVNQLRVVDGTGAERYVQARYIKDYPVGNNDWGDFQTHRRLLGLITVCKYSLFYLRRVCLPVISKRNRIVYSYFS